MMNALVIVGAVLMFLVAAIPWSTIIRWVREEVPST
jgi:hypothetical protein